MHIFIMIGRFFPVTAAAILLFPALSHAAELSQGEKDTIFIGALKVQSAVIESATSKGRSGELRSTMQSLDTQFVTALNATRVFQLVERRRKEDLELEQSFASVAVDPNDKNLAQAGKMAGAKFAFLPAIDGFEDRSETIEYQAIGRAALNRKIFLSVMVQVVDTTTGKLLPDSPSVQLTKIEVVENVRTGQATGSDRAVVELAKEMAQKLSRELVSLLRPAKVLAVTGKQLMINRGSESGFSKGDLVEIYATQEVKDEDTGETFRNEVPVGQAKVVRLDKKQSYASILGENLGIAKGCVVRTVKSQEQAENDPRGDERGHEARGSEQGGNEQLSREGAGAGDITPGSSEKPLKW